MTRTLWKLVVAAGLLSLGGLAQATLIDRGNGLIYDTVLNITWLQDANLAATDTFGVSGINSNGTMTWDTAEAWIAAMNTADYLGYNDWRLPTTTQPDSTCQYHDNDPTYGNQGYGYNCTGSEMGYLFYTDLGGTAGSPITTTHSNTTNYDLFQNVQSYLYWSGTPYAPGTSYAWYFNTTGGYQYDADKPTPMYAWAVRPGDVAATTVPEPAPLLLMGAGLVGLEIARRRPSALRRFGASRDSAL